jgi:alkylhydroperoxidase/carboxymuconolactone decarboxylase family protein YurZ
VEAHERTLRRLTIRDDAYVDFLLADPEGNLSASSLDGKTHSLVCLAALIADDATPPSYLEAVDRARYYGVSDAEIVGTLLAVLPSVGVTRVVAAAPQLGLALGFDVEAGLESPDPEAAA